MIIKVFMDTEHRKHSYNMKFWKGYHEITINCWYRRYFYLLVDSDDHGHFSQKRLDGLFSKKFSKISKISQKILNLKKKSLVLKFRVEIPESNLPFRILLTTSLYYKLYNHQTNLSLTDEFDDLKWISSTSFNSFFRCNVLRLRNNFSFRNSNYTHPLV